MPIHIPGSLKSFRFLFFALAVFIPAFWLRWLYISGDSGLYIDEYFSLWNGIQTWEKGIPVMPGGAFEIRGIIHSYLLVPVMGWGDDIAIASRFISLVLGLGTLLVVWHIGRNAWNERVGWLAAFGFAFLPEAIEASGRIRFYAPFLLLSLLLLWAAHQWSQKREKPLLPRFFVITFIVALLTLEEVILLLPFIFFGLLIWRGWKFFFQPGAMIGLGFSILAIIVRMGVESGVGATYTDLLEAQKSYFTLDFQLIEAWDTYRVLLFGGIRTFVSGFAFLALITALLQLFRERGKVTHLSRYTQSTLFFALQFLGVLLVLLLFAGWREERYLWMVQPLWLLLAVAGFGYLIEKFLKSSFYRWGTIVAVGIVLVIGLWQETWATIQFQPEGFSESFEYVADHLQPGDVVLSALPTMCPIILNRPCDYYARQRGYEDYVVFRNGNTYDRWTNIPLLNSAEQLQSVIQSAPRVWVVADGHSYGERYREDFFQILVEQSNLVFESRGVRVVLADGWQPSLPYTVSQEFQPPLEIGPYYLEAWQRSEAVPGEPLYVLLKWTQHRFSLNQVNTSVHLVAADTLRMTQADGPPAKGIITTPDNTRALLPDPKTLLLPPDLPEGRYRLELIVYDSETQIPLQSALPFTWFRIGAPPSIPTIPTPVEWQEGITLFGVEALPNQLEPASTLPVRLGWRTNAPVMRDYTGFVHLIGPDGSLIAQSDLAPENGFYPTSAWQLNDPVVESHNLLLPESLLMGGTYRLYIGWYHLESGERLLLADGTNAFELQQWTIE